MNRMICILLALGLSRLATAQTPEVYGTAYQLAVPWALAFAPDGRLFLTERAGNVRVIDAAGNLQAQPVITIPGVSIGSEQGLLGIALDPAFATNGYIYIYYTYRTTIYKNRVARLVEDGTGSAVFDAVLLDDIPGSTIHDGGRIKIGPDGKLYVGVGDATCNAAQNINSLGGKILRLNLDGTAPADNPFPAVEPNGKYVWSYGHRNPQGLAWDAQGQLYNTEHGPTGDCGWGGSSYDEVNIVYAGANYGWPICRGACGDSRFVDPLRYWTPSEGTAAPSGADFYNGSLYFGTMGFPGNQYARHLHQLTFDTDQVTILVDQVLFRRQFGRIRDVVTGPDGYLYFTNSNRDGRGGDVLQFDDDKVFRVILP